jgi:hypothetical protein
MRPINSLEKFVDEEKLETIDNYIDSMTDFEK